MAGYQCMLHDGEADATNIHQTLGKPGVIAVCDECQPMYFITALAEVLGVDAGGLYEVVRAHQVAVQQLGEPPAPPDVADQPEVPAGPHPAVVIDDGTVTRWNWCSCDAPLPHAQDGREVPPEVLGMLTSDQCPGCGTQVLATADTAARLMQEHQFTSDHIDATIQAGDQS